MKCWEKGLKQAQHKKKAEELPPPSLSVPVKYIFIDQWRFHSAQPICGTSTQLLICILCQHTQYFYFFRRTESHKINQD